MESYFSNGIYVPAIFLNQERFFSIPFKKFDKIDKSADEIHLETVNKNNNSLYKKIVFCPTMLVTGQVFNEICFPKSSHIVSGQYGIGKTYAFILYKVLSDNIYSYYHFARHHADNH
jgi:hypothetical protein